jgi:hypothetical protein
VTWPSGEIPSAFLDLPEAVTAAHQAGMVGMFDEAELQMYTTRSRGVLPVWSIKPKDASNGPYYVDGITGAVLRYQDIAQ